MNYSLALWMLLPAQRKINITSDEQHAIFAHELQSALSVTVVFWNIYCWLEQICYVNITLKLTESKRSFFIRSILYL